MSFADQRLLYKMDSLPLFTRLGSVKIISPRATSVLTGETPEKAIIATGSLGRGRVVVLTHSGYVRGFGEMPTDPSMGRLHTNIRSYASKQIVNSSSHTAEIGSRVKIVDAIRRGMLLFWRGVPFKNVSHVELEVMNYVKSGGSFVFATCPHDYRKSHGNIPLSGTPFYEVLKAAGIEITDDVLPDNAEVKVTRPNGL